MDFGTFIRFLANPQAPQHLPAGRGDSRLILRAATAAIRLEEHPHFVADAGRSLSPYPALVPDGGSGSLRQFERCLADNVRRLITAAASPDGPQEASPFSPHDIVLFEAARAALIFGGTELAQRLPLPDLLAVQNYLLHFADQEVPMTLEVTVGIAKGAVKGWTVSGKAGAILGGLWGAGMAMVGSLWRPFQSWMDLRREARHVREIVARIS